MKKVLLKINSFLKSYTPILLLLTMILGIANLVFVNKLESEIDDVQSDVSTVESEVGNISNDIDNSEVLQAIDDAESNIEGNIDAAARRIQGSIVIWSN